MESRPETLIDRPAQIEHLKQIGNRSCYGNLKEHISVIEETKWEEREFKNLFSGRKVFIIKCWKCVSEFHGIFACQIFYFVDGQLQRT